MAAGYLIYHKSQAPKEAEKFSSALKVTNYQIPLGQIDNPLIQPIGAAPSSGKPAASQKTPDSIAPRSVALAVVSQNYLKFYRDSIANFNKISPAIANVQNTLISIQEKYQSGDNNALSPLIFQGNSQNKILDTNISAFKNSLDGWLVANKDTTNEPIKSKTKETIMVGENFSQASFDLSNAITGILNYTGTGDLNQLSQQFQVAAKKMNEQGKAFNASFVGLNNLLSNL